MSLVFYLPGSETDLDFVSQYESCSFLGSSLYVATSIPQKPQRALNWDYVSGFVHLMANSSHL